MAHEALNYLHLRSFWLVAREGSLSQGARRAGLTHSTLSAQIHALERALGERLFERAGRGLELTEAGRVALTYADEIFSLGRELAGAIAGGAGGRSPRLRVGVTDAMHKVMVRALLEPARRAVPRLRLLCREDRPAPLLAALAAHELDVVLGDAPAGPLGGPRLFDHLLGECGVVLLATKPLAQALAPGFPGSLDRAPLLLPTANAAIRRGLDAWLDAHGLNPELVGEFEDSALLKAFGQEGAGVFPVPAAIEAMVVRELGVARVGRVDEVRERFYAISAERRIRHPAVTAISEAARSRLLGKPRS